jgi:hypothetical protein
MSMVLWLVMITAGAGMPLQLSSGVEASNAIVVPGPNGLTMGEFEVKNRTSQSVTAWEVKVEAMLSNGNIVTPRLAVDGYGAFAGLYPDDTNTIIRPYASVRRQISVDVPGGVTISSVKATLQWAIFADGSSFGDAAGVQAMFGRREKDRQAYAFIVTALRAGYAAGDGADALRLALERLNAKDQDDYENPDKQVMRRNLQQALAGKIQGTPKEFLRASILRMEAKWSAADEHRRARPAAPGK